MTARHLFAWSGKTLIGMGREATAVAVPAPSREPMPSPDRPADLGRDER